MLALASKRSGGAPCFLEGRLREGQRTADQQCCNQWNYVFLLACYTTFQLACPIAVKQAVLGDNS
eukprot:1160443-Pelagomonas_calceolata.AAC.11